MEARTIDDGETVFVARDEEASGSKALFYRVFRSKDRSEAFGYLCANCDTFDNAMDTMGRIVCNQCGNTHKPDEWDAVSGE